MRGGTTPASRMLELALGTDRRASSAITSGVFAGPRDVARDPPPNPPRIPLVPMSAGERLYKGVGPVLAPLLDAAADTVLPPAPERPPGPPLCARPPGATMGPRLCSRGSSRGLPSALDPAPAPASPLASGAAAPTRAPAALAMLAPRPLPEPTPGAGPLPGPPPTAAAAATGEPPPASGNAPGPAPGPASGVLFAPGVLPPSARACRAAPRLVDGAGEGPGGRQATGVDMVPVNVPTAGRPGLTLGARAGVSTGVPNGASATQGPAPRSLRIGGLALRVSGSLLRAGRVLGAGTCEPLGSPTSSMLPLCGTGCPSRAALPLPAPPPPPSLPLPTAR